MYYSVHPMDVPKRAFGIISHQGHAKDVLAWTFYNMYHVGRLKDAISRTFEMMYQLGHSVDVLARTLHEMYGMGRPKDTYFWSGTSGRELYQIGTSLGRCVLLGIYQSILLANGHICNNNC